MIAVSGTLRCAFAAVLVCSGALFAQPPSGQQLIRQGKLEEALNLYRQTLQTTPDSYAANNAMGVVLDLMGQYAEARKYFAKAIETAPASNKSSALRNMAMSYAFQRDCAGAAKYEQQAFDVFVEAKDFYNQGEMADELARVCIDAGDLDAAYKWYRTGHDAGLREPDIKPERKDLWEFRWEHAQARIAARRGNQAEAQKHVALAKAVLDKGTNPAQAPFFPYLTGYVAFYGGDFKTALAELQKANLNDPFIQCLIGETYQKLGDKDKALEYYRKAASTTGHNPPAAFARPFGKAHS